MAEKTAKRNKGLTLHPMKVKDALRVMLNTPPMKKKKPTKNQAATA
jgi:hypothetical protein